MRRRKGAVTDCILKGRVGKRHEKPQAETEGPPCLKGKQTNKHKTPPQKRLYSEIEFSTT